MMTKARRIDRQAERDSDLLAIAQVPVQRLTLSTQVADRLINLIGREGLRVGDELPSETRLIEAFHVSRPVVREALRHLAALRMIKLANGKPARVMPVTPDLLGEYFEWAVRQDVKNNLELQELRQGVESLCAELAATRVTDDERSALRSLVARMRSALSDMDAYAELDAQLHLCIAACAHNSLLRHLAESIRMPLRAAIQAGLKPLTDDPGRLEEMQRGHEAIVEAIVARNPASARSLMEHHIGTASKRIADEGARSR